MAVTFIEGGGEGGIDLATSAHATATTSWWNGSNTGTVTGVTSPVYGSAYSMKCDATGTPATCYRSRLNCLADAGRRVHVNVRFENAWGISGYAQILAFQTSVGGAVFNVQVNDTGLVRLAAGAAGASSTFQLALNTWYKFTVAYVITNSSTYDLRLYVDGVQRCQKTSSGTLPGTATNLLRVGYVNAPTANAVVYYDNIVIDDSSALTDMTQCYVTNKKPAGAGSSNAFDTLVGSGTNRWDYVSEVPNSTTNRITQAGSSQVTENFAIQSLSVGDVDLTTATILAHAGWVYANFSGATGTPSLTHAGTTVALTPTNSYRYHYDIISDATYPSTNQAVGLVSTGNANDTLLADCGVLIAYIPSGATPVAFSSTVVGAGTVSATLRTRPRLAPTAAGAATVTGTLRSRPLLAATTAGAATASASVRTRPVLVVAAAGASALVCSLRTIPRLTAAIASAATVGAAPQTRPLLAPQIASALTASSALSTPARLAVAAASAISITVGFRTGVRLDITAASTTSTTVVLRTVPRLGVMAVGAALADSAMRTRPLLSMAVVGMATVSIPITVAVPRRPGNAVLALTVRDGALLRVTRRDAATATLVARDGAEVVLSSY